ncbi:hypothetical protein AA0111_g7913 [Alternaria arborescens]|uniref:hypothetical protein n=1 Tax=Alternaria arborescens TaxID=156630 RepID=UPI0010755D5A|nr:hypothetical protein AA0111_g7913 [Alternaria arborescens]RYO26520.1 hypothetical protein AA0111_g7913 [Alternaria arborescens]
MHGTGNPIHPVVKTFCCLKWLREPYRDELLETFIGPTPLSYAIAKSQDAVAQRLLNDNLIDVNERAGAKDLGLWGKPIGIAMEQKNVTVLKSLLLTTVSYRLSLSELEVKALLEHATKLEDISIRLELQNRLKKEVIPVMRQVRESHT